MTQNTSRFRLILVLLALILPGTMMSVFALPLPTLTERITASVANGVIAVVFVVLGSFVAPAVGLDAPAIRAWLEGRSAWAVLREHWKLSVAVGVGNVLITLILSPLLFPNALPQADTSPATVTFGALVVQMMSGVLYGGIVEELMLRWGQMALFAWIAWKIFGKKGAPVNHVFYWIGAVLAAVLFGAGHLPTASVIAGGLTLSLIIRIVTLNAVAGLLFGWLFMKKGLESAILAHAAHHVALFVVNIVTVFVLS